jgi:WD40 repeat protein
MSRPPAFLLALCCISPVIAQQSTDALPPRFAPLAKNDRFRLVRVLGTPEMPAIHHQASAFSADGKLAVYAEDLSSGGDDKPRLRTRLLVWDLPARSWPREIEIDEKNVSALALSADGSKALLAGQIVVGVRKEKKKDRDKEVEVTVVDFGAYFGVWDLKTGKEVRSFPIKASEPPAGVALGPDEATALTGGKDGVQRWSLKDGKLLASFRDKAARPVMVLAHLPDGKRFLAGNWIDDAKRLGNVYLWDVARKEPVQTYPAKGDLGLILSLAVSRDGKRFVCGDTRPSLSVWETDTGKEIGVLQNKKDAVEEFVTSALLADDGKTVLAVFSKVNAEPDDAAPARLVAWDTDAKKVLWSHGVPYRGRAPMLVQDGKLLIGGGPNLFDEWDIKEGKPLTSWGGHKGTIHALAALPGGDILSAGQEGQVLTWRKGAVVGKRPAHAGAVGVMTLSPDKKQWLTAGADRIIKLWGVDGDKPVHEFKGHTGPVTSLAFSKSGWAVSASGDRTVKTWDLKTGKEIANFVDHAEAVNAVAISPDDRWIASGSDDATIRLTPVKDGKLDPDREPLLLEKHKKPISCLAFSPDGKTLLSGSQDQTMIVWDWQKEKATRTIPGHKNWITSILFIDDGSVLTTSDDLTICKWEVASGKEIGRIDFGSVADCPRCVARLGPDRLLVGTSNWLIYEFEMLPPAKSRGGARSSN